MFRRRPCAIVCLVSLLAACSSVHDDFSRQLLRPPHEWLAEPADLALEAEPFQIALSGDASLTGWWIPNPAAHGRTVVLLHEEATNVSAQHPYYTFLHEAGFQVLTFDPRGFGHSRGEPSLRAWLYDLNEVFDWLAARPDVAKDGIALFGTSLGSVAAMWAARMHPEVRAVVFEHLPSMRDQLKGTVDDPSSALGAYTVGMLEFALPEDLEPCDNAPRVEADALFIATENEPEGGRQALLRAYAAYAGNKQLWIVPGTGQAPHAMLTHDGEYQHQIAAFLTAALAGGTPGIAATAHKVRAASDGEAWYEIDLRAADRPAAQGADEPVAVEACAVLADGSPHYTRTWLEGSSGKTRIKLPSDPTCVSGTRIFAATADDAMVWKSEPTWLSRSGAAVADLWPRIEELRNDRLALTNSRQLAADLRAAAVAEPFHGRLEAELADVFAKLGLALLAGDQAGDRDEAIGWLQRAVAAVPAKPALHFWPGPVATYGFPQQDAVDEAKQRLRQLQPTDK